MSTWISWASNRLAELQDERTLLEIHFKELTSHVDPRLTNAANRLIEEKNRAIEVLYGRLQSEIRFEAVGIKRDTISGYLNHKHEQEARSHAGDQ